MSEEANALLAKWNDNSIPFQERDAVLEQLTQKGLFPRLMEANDAWESEAGLYPDTEDPRFTEKLMRKQEFAENKQISILQQKEEGVNPCDPEKEFELTPVQRFIGRFLSPQCPYQSALLYHGVGVGKTCAAVTVAENYLAAFPRRSVIIVAPRNIQSGFRRTIFDDAVLRVAEEEGVPNTAKGCTGNAYLKRTGMEYERDRGTILRAVNDSIKARYTFLGYIQFQGLIEDVLRRVSKSLGEKEAAEQRRKLLRREFSGRLLIIDEAHNLRDSPTESVDDNKDVAGGETELGEAAAGKKLTPSLMKVLDAAEGMKFLLLSGTPMYNSYREIIFLLNLMLLNDKKATLSETDIFDSKGGFKPGEAGRKGGDEILGAVANAYVSFMRGENPLSFPVRLPPADTEILRGWPAMSPDAKEITAAEKERLARLPIVAVQYEGASQQAYQRISEEAIGTDKGLGINSIDAMVQSGNWLFPTEEGLQNGDTGFDACFTDESGGSGAATFQSRTGAPKWLQTNELGKHSPKAKFILSKIPNTRGIVFIYSRFIKSGSLPLALALEANGYTAHGRDRPLLSDGIQDGLGRQCAICKRREKGHAGAGHPLVPAKYILITGKGSLSRKNPQMIEEARAMSNKYGAQIKVVIGSSVASEGVDFRFIREIYVFDSWFHLNKMEQVLGRGIRTCSHSMLPPKERNCTIHLLVNKFAGDQDTETADMYMYRRGLTKAIEVGRVTRVLKRYALDCNLNREAIVVTGLAKENHTDSQGEEREVDVNDTPFTNLCDWMETCEYTCAHPVEIKDDDMDLSTYDEYAVRWRESQLKRAIRGLFEAPRRKVTRNGKEIVTGEQPVFRLEEIQEMISAVPAFAISGLLSEILGNRSFRLTVKGVNGYLVYRNGYYMFQPDYLADVRVPLALRIASMPVRRDRFEADPIRRAAPAAEAAEEAAPAAAAAEAAPADATGAVPAAAAAVGAPAAGPAITKETLASYWGGLLNWSDAIANGTAPLEDMPAAVRTAIQARYVGDEATRELDQYTMFSWFYESIRTTPGIPEEKRVEYQRVLAAVLLEFAWDESLVIREQQSLARLEAGRARTVAPEQFLRKGEREAFRYVDPIKGVLRYICPDGPCSDAVARVFDSDAADPLNALKVDTGTTSALYGFLVPKAKTGRIVFKTAEKVPPPGGKVEKGGECAIISNISQHIRMLKDIGALFEEKGYPRFLLTDTILDEKTRTQKEKSEAKASGKKYTASRKNPLRTFENSIKACALKDLALRWLDASVKGQRYFYRPVAAYKGGHRGAGGGASGKA